MKSMIRNICVVICFAVIIVTATLTLSEENSIVCGVSSEIAEQQIDKVPRFLPGDYPWVVALMDATASPPKLFCGGTLISSTFVLTAAHCFRTNRSNKPIQARDVLALFGAHDLNNCSEPERIVLSPEKIILHEDWNAQTTGYDADLALLEFSEEKILLSTRYIQPICLWNSADGPPVIEGIVTGWAKNEDPTHVKANEPKMMQVQIRTNSECEEEKLLLDLESDRVFCITSSNAVGICHGDNGGALFINVGGTYFLKGIRSPLLLADDSCDIRTNDIYTDVLMFLDWIDETTRVYEKVFCTFEMTHSLRLGAEVKTCVVNQSIDNETSIGSDFDSEVQSFSIHDNRNVEFIPRHIGKKFPNLKVFVTSDCELTILRKFYFIGMEQVRWMDLSGNKIANIEAGAFNDLISVEWLELDRNRITTLDESIFDAMVNLEKLYLFSNEIKTLSPSTFKIPGGRLKVVGLKSNVCINDNFGLNDLERLKPFLETHCTHKSPDF